MIPDLVRILDQESLDLLLKAMQVNARRITLDLVEVQMRLAVRPRKSLTDEVDFVLPFSIPPGTENRIIRLLHELPMEIPFEQRTSSLMLPYPIYETHISQMAIS